MNQKQIDNFFQVLNKKINGKVKGKIKIILTGAAAGILLGGNRPSIDIDFALSCDKEYLETIEDAIKQASDITGIAVNFSEDIDRWSQITFLDYKKHVLDYKTFGVVEVYILAPAYWSIGKIARYLDPDVDDLVKVLKNKSVPALELAQVWGRALSSSPHSSASFTFKMHVEHFFKTYGSSIWGRGFAPDKLIQAFWHSSGIKK